MSDTPQEPVEPTEPAEPDAPESTEKSIEQQHREAIFGDTETDDAHDAEEAVEVDGE